VGDDCVFVSTDSSSGYAALGTHVDDIIVVGDSDGIKKSADLLKSEFKITTKSNPTSITGVELIRDRSRKWAKIHQCDYVTKLLEKYQMHNCTPADTPMDPGTAKALMLLPQDAFTSESTREYQAVLGCLMWLSCRTRPDLAYSVNLLSRFSRVASPEHVALIKNRPLRYLNGTRDFGIAFYPGNGEFNTYGSADADLAGDLNSARSVLSYATNLGEFGNTSFSSKLEHKICTSTGQAETYAYASLVKELIWQRQMRKCLGFPQESPSVGYSDNDGVILQSKKAINHATAKHYRIAQAFIRQTREDGVVMPVPIDTALNPSDFGTKPLGVEAFRRHRLSVMGPQSPPAL
jgi:hypothetical protein